HRELVDVTRQVEAAVAESGVVEGIALVFCPHTTASVTVNENADPDVVADLLGDERRFRHAEGNAGGHVLSSLLGVGLTLPVSGGRLRLGQWQAIWFCEWDGPRSRRVQVQVIGR